MSKVSIIIPAKYAERLAEDGRGGVLVFGDITHTIRLGRVTDPRQAFRLIDGYDAQINRRKVIADLVDRDKEGTQENNDVDG